jgi:hypothetical protein
MRRRGSLIFRSFSRIPIRRAEHLHAYADRADWRRAHTSARRTTAVGGVRADTSLSTCGLTISCGTYSISSRENQLARVSCSIGTSACFGSSFRLATSGATGKLVIQGHSATSNTKWARRRGGKTSGFARAVHHAIASDAIFERCRTVRQLANAWVGWVCVSKSRQ